jgi:hypothetical protein
MDNSDLNSTDLQEPTFNLRQGALPNSLFCARCFPITRIIRHYLSPTGVTEAVWVLARALRREWQLKVFFLTSNHQRLYSPKHLVSGRR